MQCVICNHKWQTGLTCPECQARHAFNEGTTITSASIRQAIETRDKRIRRLESILGSVALCWPEQKTNDHYVQSTIARFLEAVDEIRTNDQARSMSGAGAYKGD